MDSSTTPKPWHPDDENQWSVHEDMHWMKMHFVAIVLVVGIMGVLVAACMGKFEGQGKAKYM